MAEAGEAYIEHLEFVMERKPTTIGDYRGYLRKHLAPFFGGRPLDKIDRARVESYLLAKKRDGLSAKTIQNHLNFLNGIFRLRHQARVGDGATRSRSSTARRRRARPTAASASCSKRTSPPSSAPYPTTSSARRARRSI